MQKRLRWLSALLACNVRASYYSMHYWFIFFHKIMYIMLETKFSLNSVLDHCSRRRLLVCCLMNHCSMFLIKLFFWILIADRFRIDSYQTRMITGIWLLFVLRLYRQQVSVHRDAGHQDLSGLKAQGRTGGRPRVTPVTQHSHCMRSSCRALTLRRALTPRCLCFSSKRHR